jgi:hypothetical protein
MNIILGILIGLIFLHQQRLYGETGTWHHLVISSGALLIMLYLGVRDLEYARLLAIMGWILISAGLAWMATFGSKSEIERLNVSSWKDIVLGRTPVHLRKEGPGDRRKMGVLSPMFLFSAFIFFLGGHRVMALNFAVYGIVVAIYSLWRSRKS